MLGCRLDKAGRVIVEQDLSIPGHPEIFVIGDLAAFREKTASGERMLPGVAQVAIQGGKMAAKNILRTLRGQPRATFHYFDKGNMASIGRAAAIMERGRLRMSGFLAWIAWLFIHVMYLIGFRNRIMVMIKWAWAYIRFEKTGRLIYGGLKWGNQSD
jgi:NADH dehydrogenase